MIRSFPGFIILALLFKKSESVLYPHGCGTDSDINDYTRYYG